MNDSLLNFLSLGFLDSLNPFSIGALIYIVTKTLRYKILGIVFIVATYITYFTAGVLLLNGRNYFDLVSRISIPIIVKSILLFLIAITLLFLAIKSWKFKSIQAGISKNMLNSKSAIIIYSVIATTTDLPTAIPYFAALEIIHVSNYSTYQEYGLLFLYNLIYILPLIVALKIRERFNADSELLNNFKKCIEWGSRRIIPPLILGCSLYFFYLSLSVL
jgi:hypothetical protein